MDDLANWTPIPRTYDPLKAGSIDGTDVKPHDHGIVRAMEATYKTNKHVEGDPESTLFVARLNPSTTEERLHKYFSRYGEVKRCHLVRDVITGFSKCYGFVEFYDKRDAVEANDVNQDYIDEYKIFVDFERERILPGWIPRRLGGGFGGKKESGQLRFGGRDRPFKKPIILNKKGGGRSRGWGGHERDFEDDGSDDRRHRGGGGGGGWRRQRMDGDRWQDRQGDRYGRGRHHSSRHEERGEGWQQWRRQEDKHGSRRSHHDGRHSDYD
uniref:U11/U12 small nuclear ribonucleoprotein 35 kDa protein n=1 Tax=Ornithodoros turicata TaxID=34597 RepID=A0A2R5LJ47_9ACAR